MPVADDPPGDDPAGDEPADEAGEPSRGALSGRRYASVVVEVEPAHLDRPFDYLVPDGEQVEVGQRVEVVFAGRRVRGLVVGVDDSTDLDPARVRPLRRTLGEHRWATPDEIEVLRWAGERYAAPVASAVRHALPRRVVDVERRAAEAGWYPAAPRQPDPSAPWIDEEAWARYAGAGSTLLAATEPTARRAGGATPPAPVYWRPLPGEDLGARLVELIGRVLADGGDALIVVPEPVSAAADAVVAAFDGLVVDARGGLGQRATYRAWLEARTGRARVVVGERGVAFWPLVRLRLGIVIDESNPALKERRAPRHHAREVVLERCRRAGAPAVLVGTVPSAAAWRLLAERRLTPLTPMVEAERTAAPLVRIDDRNDPRSRGRLGSLATEALRQALADRRLGVVLTARRGEGRALACARCGLRTACPVCASSLAARAGDRPDPFCEGCGWQPRGAVTCDRCRERRFVPLAAGTRRLGEELTRSFHPVTVGVLEGYAQSAPAPPAIVVTTRGSATLDPPGPVGAVVLPDIDGQVRRPTLDAAEDALRLAVRVAGWTAPGPGAAGRGGGGVVVVQTREPDHHAVRALVRWDPGGFWRAEVARRAELRFPPVAHAVRLETDGLPAGSRVGDDLRAELPDADVLGPRPEGDGRAGLLVKVADRRAAVAALRELQRRWSLDGLDVRVDVDPVDVT